MRADEFGKLTGKEAALTKLDTATTKVQATLEGLTKKVDGLEGEGKRLGQLATTQQTSQVELRNQIEKVALLADPNKGDLARSIQGLKAQIQGLTASVGGNFDLKQLIDENKASRLAMQKATRQVAKLLGEGGEPKWARELKTGQSELKQQILLLHDEFKRAPANAGALPPSEKTVVEAVAVLRLVNPPQFEGPAIGEVRFQRRDVVVVTVRVGKPDFVGLQPGRYHLLIHENGNCHQPIDDRNPGPFAASTPSEW